ncbi:MAG: sigma-70 family RNA polymerase sigma factor [Anaerolineales bacterium]
MAENAEVSTGAAEQNRTPDNYKTRLTATSARIKVDEVEIYLQEAGKVPLLTRAEEVDLAQRIEAGREASRKLAEGEARRSNALISIIEDGARAREHMILANLRLVISVAKKYQNLGLPLLDLIQEGNLGLMRAIKKFDYRKGFKFSTYATWWIRQAITRSVADKGRVIRLPVHVHTQLRQIRRTKQRLQHELEREPTATEIATHVEISATRIKELMRQTKSSVTLDTPDEDEEDAALFERIPDEDAPDPIVLLSDQENSEQVQNLLEVLTPREERVLRLRYGLSGGAPLSLSAIGNKIELTRERVRQIEEAALTRLRRQVRNQERIAA